MAEFEALGKSGAKFIKLETFKAIDPSISLNIQLVSQELLCNCPITNQPDYYFIEINYHPQKGICLETKSLKLYLQTFRDTKYFAEDLAFVIGTELKKVLATDIRIILTQNIRGGIITTVEWQS
jgi:7-cyano-7-deazaguanine reductase